MYRSSSIKQPRWKTPLSLVIAVPILILLILALWRVGPEPEVSISSDLPGIGPTTAFTIQAREQSRGLGDVKVELIQGEKITSLESHQYEQQPFWAFWQKFTPRTEVSLDIGSQTLPNLETGEATVRVTVDRASTWLRKPPPTIVEKSYPVRLTPPSIAVISTPNYITQGGSALLVYHVGKHATRHGVRIGDFLFPGSPLDGENSVQQFVFFGAPHDLTDSTAIQLVAQDELGNEATLPVIDRYKPAPLRTDTIQLSDRFMQRVVPQIRAQTPSLEDQGNLLDNYLAINRDLRHKNAQYLIELSKQSTQEILWQEPFLQLPGSQAMASFADRRTYVYEGRDVDQQDHLGFDLASVRRAPVVAANRGIVLMAEYFGIYGNTVVLDHGYGVMSLYSHMSSFEVQTGQTVERGTSLGRTGETGLAGGDHLHFSILVHGLQVNPLEWWDPNWVRDRIFAKLEDV